jgi:hypothetical protein
MSRSSGAGMANEPDGHEAEAVRGLIDPRTIHPSPEGIFPDPIESPESVTSSEEEPPPPDEDLASEQGIGIVDPRDQSTGPAI